MTRATLVGLCLLAVARAQAQEPTVLSALGLEPVAWARWEIRVPDKREWLARAGIPLPPAFAAHADDMLPYFHVMDVDADGRADVVYSGPQWCGFAYAGDPPPCDGSLTAVYRNTGTRFVPAFDGPGEIVALVRPAPQQALHIAMNRWRDAECVGPGLYPEVLVFLRPSARPDTAVFRREDVVFYNNTRWPRERLPAPLPLRVTQNQYNLRWAPAVDDTTRGETCEWTWRGNVLATFARGATAVALAELRDGTRTWYFVMTDSASAFTSAHPDVRGGTRLLGWMSARYLKTLP